MQKNLIMFKSKIILDTIINTYDELLYRKDTHVIMTNTHPTVVALYYSVDSDIAVTFTLMYDKDTTNIISINSEEDQR